MAAEEIVAQGGTAIIAEASMSRGYRMRNCTPW